MNTNYINQKSMWKTSLRSVFFLMITFNLQGQSDTDVLITVNQRPVLVDEFKYIYQKNNGDNATYSKESVNEYLDLYVKFKLKVAKAREMQLDTISVLKEELAGYRKQLANSYLMDKEVTDHLIQELYDRFKRDVKIRHILIETTDKDSAQKQYDSLAKANQLRKKLVSGADFEAAAKEHSDDKASAKNGGLLGFTTAMFPNGFYNLETAAYNTEVGGISEVVKTKLGFHIVKVEETRPSRGQMQVAQILFRNSNDEKMGNSAKERAEKTYKDLLDGMDFTELAKTISEDKHTLKQGGVLPEFGINVYEVAFEDAAFALAKDEDISKPIQTKLGWHIIKRMSKVESADFETFSRRMEAKIQKDDRYEKEKLALIERIKSASDFKQNVGAFNNLVKTIDPEFYTYKWQPEEALHIELFNFGNQVYYLDEFVDHLKKNTRERLKFDRQKPIEESVRAMLDAYIADKAIVYEEAKLEDKYPDFKALMREYEEGILLFEATKMEVWDKAAKDTVGLYQYYEKNAGNYMWDPSAKITRFIVNTTDTSELEKIMEYAMKKDKLKVLEKFNKKDKIMIELIELQAEINDKNTQGLEWKVGAISQPIIDKKSKKSSFRILQEIIEPRRKVLSEARGYVIADYQDHLEKRWIAQLKKQFEVKIHEDVLKKMIK